MGEQIKGPKINSFKIGVNIIKQEGFFGLYHGLSASLARQFTYSSARIGSYPYMKALIQSDPKVPLGLVGKISAGMMSGCIGAIAGNPADLINVRMQADAKLPLELKRNYRNVFHGIGSIVKQEGIFALWRGCYPNVIRGMLMTSGQMASYDQAKEMLLKTPYFKDDLATHFTAGAIAGVVATVICSPIDVIKTRLMNMKIENGKGLYSGVGDCGIKTLRSEGFMAFFKGFGPSVSRLVPHTILTFVFYEQFAKLIK